MKSVCVGILLRLLAAEANPYYPGNAAWNGVRNSFVLVLLWVASTAMAGTVRLAWSPSPSAGVTGYALYAGTNSPLTVSNALVRVDAGTNLTATVDCTNASTIITNIERIQLGQRNNNNGNTNNLTYFDNMKWQLGTTNRLYP